MKTAETAQFVALIVGWVAFMVYARARLRWRQYRRDNPSPVDAHLVWNWIKLLVRPDPDPDTDTEPDTAGKRGYRLRQTGENTNAVDWINPGDELPPAQPEPSKGPTELHNWIRRSLDVDATYGQIVREGRRLFGVSEASMKRAIRQVRSARARGART